jgi:hypothetical protein
MPVNAVALALIQTLSDYFWGVALALSDAVALALIQTLQTILGV